MVDWPHYPSHKASEPKAGAVVEVPREVLISELRGLCGHLGLADALEEVRAAPGHEYLRLSWPL
jgi:hypothetical protein